METIHFGTLGAARITPNALIKPGNALDEIDVVAVAARDRERAEKFGAKHWIPTVHDSYEALIDDPAGRGRLQPAAERLARQVDDRRPRGGQARAVREAVHGQHRRGGEGRGGGGCVTRARRDGGVPLPVSPARRAAPRDHRVGRARSGTPHRDPHVLPAPAVQRHPVPARSRRWRAHGCRVLHDPPAADAGERGAGGRLGAGEDACARVSTGGRRPRCASPTAGPAASSARCGRARSSRWVHVSRASSGC